MPSREGITTSTYLRLFYNPVLSACAIYLQFSLTTLYSIISFVYLSVGVFAHVYVLRVLDLVAIFNRNHFDALMNTFIRQNDRDREATPGAPTPGAPDIWPRNFTPEVDINPP